MSIKNLITPIMLFWALSTAVAAENVTVIKQPVKLNGVLSEECWTIQKPLAVFTNTKGKNLELATEVKIARSNNAVYFAARCAIPVNEKFRATASPANGGKGMGKDDCVVFTLFPGSEKDNYYAFYINARGAVWCEYMSQGGFVSNAVTLPHVKAKSVQDSKNKVWSVELYVPFANLKFNTLPGKVWGWNAGRIPRYMPGTHTLLQGRLFLPDARRDLAGFDMPMQDFMLDVTPQKIIYQADKKHKFSYNITNRTGKTVTLRVQSELLKQAKSYMANRVTLKPDESKVVTLTPPMEVKDGAYRINLVIKNAQTRQTCFMRIYPATIKFDPWQTVLQSPCYRNMIFATEKSPKIVIDIKTLVGGKTTAVLADSKGEKIAEQHVENNGTVTFPAEQLPVGKYTVTLLGPAIDNVPMQKVYTITKLAPHAGEVRRDSEGFWLKDGKRIFLISEWNDVHLPGTNAMQFWKVPRTLKTAHGIAFSLSGSYMRKAHYRNNRTQLDEKGKAAVSQTVKKQMNYEKLFCWQISDEPEGRASGVKPALYYDLHKLLRELDPYHPVSIGTFTIHGMRNYAGCAEINFLHPYPIPLMNIPRSCFSKVVEFMDAFENLRQTLGNQAPSMIYLLQGFNYGDLIGSQRVPTYDELRTQAIMSLISGGQGVMFYNRNAEFYPELALGTPAMVKELKILEPVMVESNYQTPDLKAPARPFRWILKKHKGDFWIFAGSFKPETLQANMEIPALKDCKLYVFGENRTVEVKDGKFSDTFKNFDTHIYTTNEKMAKAIDFAAVEKSIQKAYEKRRKPGNIAFQQNEDEKLQVTASSSIFATARRSRNSALWHVTDGAFRNGDRMYFEAKAPGTGGEWLELKFHNPIEFSKVDIYPLNDSLCDYVVEAKQGEKYVTLSEMKNASGKVQSHKFDTFKSDTIRIRAIKSRKAMSIIEIEIYK